MYKVKWNGPSGVEKQISVPTLDSALAFGRSLGITVTISDGETEMIGKIGVDSVKEGVLPDGTPYSWFKRRLL